MAQSSESQEIRPVEKKSFTKLLVNLIVLIISLVLLLFIPAGRLDWFQAWAFILAYGGLLLIFAVFVLRRDPGLMEERSRIGQNTKPWDKVILSIYTLLLLTMLVVAGLDAGRFHWSAVPPVLQALGWLGALFSGMIVYWTTSVNTFLSRTVRIQEERGQVVIDSGPYAWVRHPLYLGIIVLMLSIPLLLGSFWSLILGGSICLIFIVRTALEDHTLQQELPRYKEYTSRVKYRLVPRIW